MRVAAAIGLAALLVVSGSAQGARGRAAAAPRFVAPSAAAPLAVPGKAYAGYSFCEPTPAAGHVCGGPLNRGQVNPSGGNGGPYVFALAYGFLPTGLTLSSRTGVVSGTVNANAERRAYPFMVCTSDTSAFPRPGAQGTTCIAASITVGDASSAYDGGYTLVLTGTYKDLRNGDIYPLHGGAGITVNAGKITSSPLSMTGSVDATGTARVKYYDVAGDKTACPLTLHFTTHGTTTPLAYHCSGARIAETGTMTLKRWWPTPAG